VGTGLLGAAVAGRAISALSGPAHNLQPLFLGKDALPFECRTSPLNLAATGPAVV